MDEQVWEEHYGAKTLMIELKDMVAGQTPTGFDPEVGLVMDVTETVSLVQVWMMKSFAIVAEGQMTAQQYIDAISNVVAVAGIQLAAVQAAVLEDDEDEEDD